MNMTNGQFTTAIADAAAGKPAALAALCDDPRYVRAMAKATLINAALEHLEELWPEQERRPFAVERAEMRRAHAIQRLRESMRKHEEDHAREQQIRREEIERLMSTKVEDWL